MCCLQLFLTLHVMSSKIRMFVAFGSGLLQEQSKGSHLTLKLKIPIAQSLGLPVASCTGAQRCNCGSAASGLQLLTQSLHFGFQALLLSLVLAHRARQPILEIFTLAIQCVPLTLQSQTLAFHLVDATPLLSPLLFELIPLPRQLMDLCSIMACPPIRLTPLLLSLSAGFVQLCPQAVAFALRAKKLKLEVACRFSLQSRS
mmetsp:Transcript_107862/g.198102  ORF Transcript_107862/g.198102 Transcript_107862/m.198102 type:complete len:201 (-) Transcript_107862:208-810(-)